MRGFKYLFQSETNNVDVFWVSKLTAQRLNSFHLDIRT